MDLPSVDYTPRDPAADVLHGVVREHLQTFLAEAAHRRDGEGVPRFVEEEFQAFLSCGWLAGGFARFRCVGCRPSAWSPSRASAEASVQAVAAGA